MTRKTTDLLADPVAQFEAALSQWGPLALDADALRLHSHAWTVDLSLSAADREHEAAHPVPFYGFEELDLQLTVRTSGDGSYNVVTARGGQATANGQRTAIIPIVGPITPFALPEWMERYGIKVASLPKIVASARAAANDPDVSRIVLAIHSPGGSVYGMPEAAAALREVAKRKKMVASINYLGASAAYWLAATTSEITATPSALIGSVGAAIRHVSFARMAEMDGVDVTDISIPASKRDVTEFKQLSETGKAELTNIVAVAYEQFKTDISATRRLDFTAHGEQYARVVPAADALGLNLVDRVATFDTVLGEGPSIDLPGVTRRARARLAHLKRNSTDA